jgi:signal transduction histidine kinase/ligand-binding sensor domain-containing protein
MFSHKQNALLIAMVLLLGSAVAQKYNFVNWTVEDGLVQSQASYVCQDPFRQLWIGTEGGLSCFDGKKFRSYTIQDGLPGNRITCLLSSRDTALWIGTTKGLARFNGTRFVTIKLDKRADHIRDILQTSDGTIYAISNFRLFEISGKRTSSLLVTGDTTEKISAIFCDGKNSLMACVYGKGIYTGNTHGWKLSAASPEQETRVVFTAFITRTGDSLLAYNNGLHVIRNGKIERFRAGEHDPKFQVALCMGEDEKGSLWIGTDQGACKVEDGRFVYFNGKGGFTDNSVNQIFRDAENNLWFATNADGIYKYRENTFTYYDQSAGLRNPIVMGVAQTEDGQIYVSGYGGGLFVTDGNSPLRETAGTQALQGAKVNCVYAARNNVVWIGTLNQGIYSYQKEKGLQKLSSTTVDFMPVGATVLLEDKKGNLLIGSSHGLFIRTREGKLQWVETPPLLVTALKQLDDDQTLIGTSKGVYFLNKNYEAKPFHENKLGLQSVMCMTINGDYLWLGTSDRGIFRYDMKKELLGEYNTADGLPSNFIYSIDAGKSGRLWAGTGFGISRLELNAEGKIISIKNYGRSDGLLGMECNHNSLLRAADSSLWFGTTKGLFHFNPHQGVTEKTRPLVLIKSVKLFSSGIKDSGLYTASGHWFDLPTGLKLSSKQNHLSFELGAMYFTNPEDVLFRYKLEGIDKVYTTSNSPFIMYPSLPPGKYTLKAKGVTKAGVESVNEVQYAFEIEKAFYQTSYFQVLVIVVLLGTGGLIAFLITRARHRRRQHEKELHERIREEEFAKLRQRTAEDFHDEMGNSLTRISVLTDVLKVKLNGTEKEVSHLVQQIKDNTTSLYNGSRDIIWSLNSKNDALFEIAEHIKDIGNELFQDTPVEFRYSHNIPRGDDHKLKLDYSRNLTMIFKEAYSNILKHAGASKVEVDLELMEDRSLIVRLSDNGSGFSSEQTAKGNGLKNMQNRVRRMQGMFDVNSNNLQGTVISIQLRDIFVN